MLWCLYLCLLAPVLLDDALASDVNLIVSRQQRFRVPKDTTVAVSLRRESGSTSNCFVILPDGSQHEVTETSAPPGVAWASRPTSVTACNIAVGPVTDASVGHWILFATFIENNISTEARQPFVIELDDGITVQPLQELWTHHGAKVDLSLNSLGTPQISCHLEDPEGNHYNMTELPDGIEPHNSTKYTSCAVTFNYIDDTQLGLWTLIERGANSGERHQPALLKYADEADPDLWQVASEIERRVVAATGSIVTLSVGRTQGFFLGCFLRTPDHITLPVYSKDYPGITFVIANFVSACNINILLVDNEMFGHWTLAALFDIDGIPTEIRQPVRIVQTSAAIILPRIRYATAQSEYVDINLNQTGQTGTCRLRDPTGRDLPLSTGTPSGGAQLMSSNDLVSCRVRIGPMTDTLLGEWTLIQEISGIRRELPAVISWANPVDPMTRQVIIAPEHGAKVEIEGTTSVSVGREDGLFEGCFLTAPSGATVPVFDNTRYPGITLDRPNRFASCVVAIGPAQDTTFGRWTLFAIYNVGGERIESRQPFNILRDDGIRTLSTTFYYTYVNEHVDINLNQTGAIGTCILKSPDGIEHILDTSFNLPGVVVQHSNKFVSCRVTIGPMSATLLNEWMLIQRIAGESEKRQPVNIQWATPSNPNAEPNVINGEEQSVVSGFGDIVVVSTNNTQGILEGCFLTTPDGSILRISGDRRYPGVTFSRGTSISPCNALLGPIDDNMAGTWIMTAIFNENGARTKMQRATVITRSSSTESVLPTLTHITNVDAFVDINLNAIGKTVDSCRLVTPQHEVHTLDETFDVMGVMVHNDSSLVTCQVTIGPMHHELLGLWTLIEHNSDGTLRRRSVNIAWADPANPFREARKFVIAARQEYIVNESGYVTVSVPREPGFDEGCFVETPDRDFLPISEVTSYPGVEWTSRPTSISACSVMFGPIDEKMVGRWVVGARFNDVGLRIEKHQPINIMLADGTTTLPMLEYYTHGDAYVDINLNRTGTPDSCQLTDPRGHTHDLNTNTIIPGVTVYNSNQIVSCRAYIGPMSNSLVGEWIIIERQANITRRQPVIISWIDPSNPTIERDVSLGTDTNIDVVVGNVFSTSIGRQNGSLEGCFMITPDGASLPVFPNTRYPGVVFTGGNSVASCLVQMGPVHTEMTGKWTLVAKYNNHGIRTKLQNTITINVKESSDLTPIVLPRQEHLLSADANIDISLSNTGTTGDCRLTTPAGKDYILTGSIALAGVTVQSSSKYVACRVTIGPLTTDLLGDWILSQPYTNNTLRQQPVRISWANPLNPSQNRELIVAPQQPVVVDTGDIFNVSIDREDGFGEGCIVITPDGAYLPVTDDVSYPGISWIHRPTSVSFCTIEFGPVDADMVGRWTVLARFNHGGIRIESHQPIHLFIADGTSYLPFVEYLTHIGGTIDIALNQTGVGGTCHLIDPSQQEHSLDTDFSLTGVTVQSSDNFVSCWVRVGPMTDSLLGEWMLIERHEDGTERRQVTRIVWTNLQDPAAESREIITSDAQHVPTERGSMITLNGQRHDSGQFEGCFIIPPDAAMLPIFPQHDYPGITFTGARSTAPCVVDIGPIEDHMIGNWTLASRFNMNGDRVEIRLPAQIEIYNPVRAWVIVVSVLASVVVVAVIALFAFKRSRNWSARNFSRLRSSMRSTTSRNNLVHHEMNDHGSINVH